jgi:MerR family transcriptional regulator, heat shock protein HspR
MVQKNSRVQPIKNDLPLYSIGVAAQLLDLHPRTLRIYEDEGLIKPHRQGTRRLYSPNDLQWIRCLRSLIHDEGISIPGIKKLLHFAPCYEIAACPEEILCTCDAVVDRAIPRSLRLAGSALAEKKAKEKDLEKRAQQLQSARKGTPDKKIKNR